MSAAAKRKAKRKAKEKAKKEGGTAAEAAAEEAGRGGAGWGLRKQVAGQRLGGMR